MHCCMAVCMAVCIVNSMHTPETVPQGEFGISFRRKDFRDRMDRQVLVLIGR